MPSNETDELEILISRFAAGDDTLTPDERSRVERELDRAAVANELLAGEHRLTDLLRTADPAPPINYERLAARISASIPQTVEPTGHVETTRPATAARSFWSMPRVAMAASVLIAAGVAVPLLVNDRATPDTPSDTGVNVSASDGGTSSVAVTTIRAVDGNASLAKSERDGDATNVNVGPSPTLSGKPGGSQYGLGGEPGDPQHSPSRVVITPQSETGTGDGPLSPR